jgi:hypothetical protein
MNITFLNSRDQINHIERTQVATTVPDRDQVATLIVTRYPVRYVPVPTRYRMLQIGTVPDTVGTVTKVDKAD